MSQVVSSARLRALRLVLKRAYPDKLVGPVSRRSAVWEVRGAGHPAWFLFAYRGYIHMSERGLCSKHGASMPLTSLLAFGAMVAGIAWINFCTLVPAAREGPYAT